MAGVGRCAIVGAILFLISAIRLSIMMKPTRQDATCLATGG